jgi:hypothetical protein
VYARVCACLQTYLFQLPPPFGPGSLGGAVDGSILSVRLSLWQQHMALLSGNTAANSNLLAFHQSLMLHKPDAAWSSARQRLFRFRNVQRCVRCGAGHT